MNARAVDTVALRAAQLAALYRGIAATRMAEVPICHPGLAVAAVGFAPEPDGRGALGVLLTPWFMNLVWWALDEAADRPAGAAAAALGGSGIGMGTGAIANPSASAATARPPEAPLRVGATRVRVVGGQAFEFMGHHEPAFGPFEACSLFSPMHEFADQAGALATAEAVLSLLRQPPAVVVQAPQPAVPARRGFLLGRSAAAPGPAP